jgi:hypothetical protein
MSLSLFVYSTPRKAVHPEPLALTRRDLPLAPVDHRRLQPALFEIAPEDSDHLDDGPVWACLFTQAVGRDADPAWAGPPGEFTGEKTNEHAAVPVRVYPGAIDIDGGKH